MERWQKAGADDLITAFGIDPIIAAINAAIEPSESRELDDYRQSIRAGRDEDFRVTLDRSETGAGKTTADISLAAKYDTSATFVPTHKNAEELQKKMVQLHSLDVEAYPKLCEDTCYNLDAAEDAMERGFLPTATVCLPCPMRDQCEYRSQTEAAGSAPHVIATHKRGEVAMDSVIEEKAIVIIQEDASGILARTETASDGFYDLAASAESAAVVIAGKDGQQKQVGYLLAIRDMATSIAQRLENGPPGEINLPEAFPAAAGAELALYESTKAHEQPLRPDVPVITRAAVTGKLSRLIMRESRHANGTTMRNVTALFKAPDLSNFRLHVSDASTTPEKLDLLLDVAPGTTRDITPQGRLQRLHRQVQFPKDVTKQTSIERVVHIVRQIATMFPDKRRIGIITLQLHAEKLRQALPPELAARTVIITYYRSGDDRGSNRFVDEKCDLLICLGTPHVANSALQDWMIQQGVPSEIVNGGGRWHRSDSRDDRGQTGGPGAFAWTGWTESGRELRVIRCGGYADWDWHDAFQAVVIGQLKQAIGRARTCCPDGMDVVAVSQYDLRLKLLDQRPLTPSELEVFEVISGGTDIATVPLYIIKENGCDKSSVTTAALANHFRVSQALIRRHLASLASKGWIIPHGQNKGRRWSLIGSSPRSPIDCPPGPAWAMRDPRDGALSAATA